MAIGDLKDILHRIRIKLYPNYFPNVEGAYIARTDSEASLTIDDVCTAMKNRGGFTGKYEDLVDYIRQYQDEVAYQLCDGYAVNTGYYAIYPNIGGTFNSDKEVHDHKKHPITFRFRTLTKLRKIVDTIEVVIDSVADTQGYIAEFIDVKSDAVNESLTPGSGFIIEGFKIKIAGDDPSNGVYFVRGDDEKRLMEPLSLNTSSKLIGIIPTNLGSGASYKIRIRTQFSGATNTPLKNPRIIDSGFALDLP